MSLFGNLGGMLRDLVDRYGGPEAVAGQVFAQLGGVDGVLNMLRQAGLGPQVSSWLGTGANQTVDASSIANAIGHGRLADVAAKVGMSPDQLSDVLSHVLPGVVDKLSPDGHLAAGQPNPGDGMAP